MPTIALVAGEASGDIHAANLVRSLRQIRPDLSCWAVGGGALQAAGAEIVFPSEAIAGMGLWEAMSRLPALARARRTVLDRFRTSPPDLFIPVDFGGLNLRLASSAQRAGIPVVYYIPPKVWAWGSWRAKKLSEVVDEALVILPFEEEALRGLGVRARYVGSPVLDHLAPRGFEPEADVVGLLPGSRPGEISRIWPLLLEAARGIHEGRNVRFLAPRAPGLPAGLLEEPVAAAGVSVEILDGRSQEVMERARGSLRDRDLGVCPGGHTARGRLSGEPTDVLPRPAPRARPVHRPAQSHRGPGNNPGVRTDRARPRGSSG